jgi:two-component system chemotaxis response regulator CheB
MTEREPIRVLVVDDSAFNRRTIAEILDTSQMAKVVAVARDGEEAIKKAFDTRPDLITLDLEMPKMDGFTFLRIIMKSLPTPVLVISSRSEDKNVFRALELGAIDFLAKPMNHLQTGEALRQDLLTKLRMVGELRMRNLQRRVNRLTSPQEAIVPKPILMEDASARKPAGVVIGASTGGPSALQSVISALPKDLASPILVSQHMPAGFTRAFAERLDRNAGLKVKEAEEGETLEPATVFIAPGGMNLEIKSSGDRLLATLRPRADTDKYVPSVNALFHSAARAFADRCLAVVLTGMGNDGADGVRSIKDAGGQIIAESEKTSIVFGMPREAINTRRVDEVLNLDDIPAAIIRRCRGKG